MRTVPRATLTTAAPVALARPASFGDGQSLRLTSITAITVKAHVPGEFSGPALRLAFAFHNGGSSAINLDAFVANLADDRSRSALPVTTSPARPFHGTVRPGGTATGVYVFTVPTAQRKRITVSASYTASAPVVLFVGTAK